MNLLKSISAVAGGKSSRRSFLRRAFGIGAGAAVVPGALSFATRTARAENSGEVAQDLAVLTLALNLEYLEAEYYTYAERGTGIADNGVGVDGKTAPGTTTVKAGAKVPFSDPVIAAYATEIAQDERNHVNFLRSVFVAAGVQPPAKPDIDLMSSFDTAAAAAGIGSSFDPFASDTNFLLGSFIFEDVGVTAYHGGAPLLNNGDYLSAAAGILAVEAMHAALVRASLLALGDSSVTAIVGQISALRDALDGNSSKDQSIVDANGTPNIVPTPPNAVVYDRTEKKVLNIVYGAKGVSGGLFFPSGINR